MITSQRKPLEAELESNGPISERNLAYLAARANNNFYDYVMGKFLVAETGGLTRAELSRKTGIPQSVLSRTLAAPGNWTIGTVAKLLAGICAEELKPDSESFLNRPAVNYTQADILANVTPGITFSSNEILLDTKREAVKLTEDTIDATITGIPIGKTPTGADASA